MGYTHYWRFKEPTIAEQWSARIADCDKIIAATEKQYELDREFSDALTLALNGPDDNRNLSHETFTVPRTKTGITTFILEKKVNWPGDAEMWGFDFCKTAQKPYDDVVVACLCVLAEAGLNVSSDGAPEEWEHGRALAQEILGRPVALPKTLTEATS